MRLYMSDNPVPFVRKDGIHLFNGVRWDFDSKEWQDWLVASRHTPKAKFRFEYELIYEIQPGTGITSSKKISFTAFRAKPGSPYWNAQRRKDGILRTRYLGKDSELTSFELMLEVALLLEKNQTKDERPSSSTVKESHNSDNYATVDKQSSQATESSEVSKLKTEINRLQEELEKSKNRTNLPDLYAIRDEVLQDWRLANRRESKARFYEFANQLIDQLMTIDSDYTMLDRLKSDLEQEKQWSEAQAQSKFNWHSEYIKARDKLRSLGVNA